MKRDNWEGGHRIPFIARWPEKIEAGRKTDQTVCLCDIMATCAELVGAELANDCAEDSYSILPVILGEQPEDRSIREYTLHQTISLALGIRKGKWKYLDHPFSGGNNYDKNPMLKEYALPYLEGAEGQLYDLESDPGETTNLYFEYPEIVEELKVKLYEYRDSGRSVIR
jgi:arylsulfatase A-like enzyme